MFNLPRKAQIGEIIRAKGYEGLLLLVLEFTEEVEHYADGTKSAIVVYTCRNIDDEDDILIIFDEDVEAIAATSDRATEFIRQRRQKGTPPAPKPFNNEAIAESIMRFMRGFEDGAKKGEQARNSSKNNAPRTQWQKEREAKRKAYEYVDFILDRYAELVSLNEILGEDEERNEEIAILKAEFEKTTGTKTIQDGKFA